MIINVGVMEMIRQVRPLCGQSATSPSSADSTMNGSKMLPDAFQIKNLCLFTPAGFQSLSRFQPSEQPPHTLKSCFIDLFKHQTKEGNSDLNIISWDL